MELNELMQGFAEKVGLDEIKADESGAYALSFDDFDVGFKEDNEGELIIVSPFATKPQEGADRIAEILLGANHFFLATGGATIALDNESGEYVLQRSYPLSVLDGESFMTLVEGFVNKLDELKTLVTEFRPAFDKANEVVEAEREEVAEFGMNGFMQV